MKKLLQTVTLATLVGTSPLALAEKDCLLEGTVEKSGSGAEQSTMVKIHSVKKYDDASRCRVRRGEKLEFKLPSDDRLESAPSGSEVKYRYRSNNGGANAELISVDADQLGIGAAIV